MGLGPSIVRNELHCPNGGPTWSEDHFLSPFVQKRREVSLPVSTKVSLKLSPEMPKLFAPFRCTPCPTLSAGVEHKSQGHCRKWPHKLKVVWCLYVSIAYNQLKGMHNSIIMGYLIILMKFLGSASFKCNFRTEVSYSWFCKHQWHAVPLCNRNVNDIHDLCNTILNHLDWRYSQQSAR